MNNMKDVLGPMRLPFVLLAPACVLVGLGTALRTNGQVNWLYFVLVLIGAVFAHISVNVFNEYIDFKTGLDAKTMRTPFSGGSGTLPAKPEMAYITRITAWIALVISGLIGLFFTYVWGWELIPLGIIGFFLLYGYTAWLVYRPLPCLLAPGFGFGTLIVVGTHFALTGQYSWIAFFASFVPFFLVSDLLLLNQFPDMEADKSVGKKHYPILLGRKASRYIYITFLLLAYLRIVAGVVFNILPIFSLLGLATLALALPVIHRVWLYSEDIPKLMPALGQNVLINLLTPVLVAIGLIIK